LPIADEYRAAMRVLWDEPARRFVSFVEVERPRPTQRPQPPIVGGGHSPPAYRRAIAVANGWCGWELREGTTRHERPRVLGAL
jgi:alkanesulfonate monooxygenase SsuD/methylene tetrahydromethanopterin reductase-like flavin-dependent oxidoreductase (luciferase family)